MNLEHIQQALRDAGLGGWLFYDFDNRDPIAYRMLGLPNKHTSRRWYYYVPATGEPTRLVHSVEPGKLDTLPGKKIPYRTWETMQAELRTLLAGQGKVAMQYSPDCTIPYLSRVDAGTVELVRSCGVEVVSSADLVSRFEAVLDAAGWESHQLAGDKMHAVLGETWAEIARQLRAGEPCTENGIQTFMVQRYAHHGLDCEGQFPIVAVNAHAGDPHFDPTPEAGGPIKDGDAILIDLWAKLAQPGSIYYDITWCGIVGDGPIPKKYQEIWDIACAARDRAVAFVTDRLASGEPLYGYEVDRACRQVIETQGYGPYFVHRTGHSIGEQVHGNGAHIDDLETRDRRELIPGLLFSIEPGIYLAEEAGLGVRTEIDVFIGPDRRPQIYGPIQHELVRVR